MRAALKLLVLAPVAFALLAFALANRQTVMLFIDPMNGGDPASPHVPAPLFVIVIISIMIGVVFGGFSSWLRQGRHRKAAREARAKADDLRAENALLRNQMASVKPADRVVALPATRSAA